jgi:hypothetical protein
MAYITKTNLSEGPQFGSQMAQYAGLYAVSKKLGFDIVFFEEYMNVFRKVKLFEAFNLKNPILSIHQSHDRYELKDVVLDSDVYNLDTTKNWDIGGWFHLYHYWHDYRDELLNIFKFKDEIYDMALANINVVKNNENYPIVSLHVRRGDYVQLASLNLSLDYYIEAVNKFISDGKYFKLLVFSDDIEWCKTYIVGENVYYSENNTNYVDMCMMTLCDHNIIANSTFSWWGAYLNQNPNKIVICPEDYVGNSDAASQFINKNYYPNEWISLKIK